jgi:hypothetical protein
MRTHRAAACVCLLGACATAQSSTAPSPCTGFRNAEGPYASLRPAFTALPPAVQLVAEREVISLGETPRVMVHTDAPNPTGGYHETSEFTVRNPDGTRNDGPCDPARKPGSSSGFAVLNFECHPFTQLGVYSIRFEPARSGIAGDPVEIKMRVVNSAPQTPPAPSGWAAVALWNGFPERNCYSGFSYVASLDHERLVKGEAPAQAKLPALLASRMSDAHARTVKYVFEADDGWVVMFDHGEFGGGIEWFARAGGQPRSVLIGAQKEDDIVPQNVNRALLADGVIYVLQGIAHLDTNEGQLAKIWREHDHFTSQVIAQYSSEPGDWIRTDDGSWFVATWHAIWQTREGAASILISRLPGIMWYPTSLLRAAGGTFFVGTRGGVVRLTPVWPDAPRYAVDFLSEAGAQRRDCPTGEEPAE